jgi:CRISPR-associated endonuclease/helicase Cas3
VLAHTPSQPGQKPHALAEHLLGVGRLAGEAGRTCGINTWSQLAGRWHDLGKFRPRFQAYLRGEVKKGDNTSHKLAGAAWALEHLARHPAGMPIALAIGGHHGGLPAWSSATGGLSQRWEQAKQELAEARVGGAGDHLTGDPGPVDPALDATMRSLSDEDRKFACELLTRMLFSTLIDADWADTTAYHDGVPANPVDAPAERTAMQQLADRLDRHLQSLTGDGPVNQQRRAVQTACRTAAEGPVGIHELTVPTGGGKTLAAMLFALRHAVVHGLRRVVVVLPFTSIIEQNAAVYRQIFGDDAVLEHHSNLDPEADQAGTGHLWKLRAETWDAPIIVTTNVQFLESLHTNLPSRVRKLHRLAQSVVILDECQALPLPLLDATCDTLRVFSRIFRTTLVTCTATQPALRPSSVLGQHHERLGAGIRTIIADPAPLFAALSRVTVAWPVDPTLPVGWPELARDLAAESRALVIVHRRQDARELTLAVDAVTGDESTIHLSAQMIPAHRSLVLAEIRRRLLDGEPCRVVATTLVEAGVDLDFPVVFRCLGGLDALAQAAGRCNREGRLATGHFRVFRAPTAPPPGMDVNLNITLGLLRQGPVDLQDPAVFQRYFTELYQQATDAAGICSFRQGVHSDFPEIAARYRVIDNDHSRAVVVDWPGLVPTIRSSIARLRTGFPSGDDLRRVQRASATLPVRTVGMWLASGLLTAHARHPVPVLNLEGQAWLYDERFGLCPEADPEPPTASLIL